MNNIHTTSYDVMNAPQRPATFCTGGLSDGRWHLGTDENQNAWALPENYQLQAKTASVVFMTYWCCSNAGKAEPTHYQS
jgi:hypothetical protein